MLARQAFTPPVHSSAFFFFFSQTGSPYIAQAGLALAILLALGLQGCPALSPSFFFF
jgi:hypothetical protein